MMYRYITMKRSLSITYMREEYGNEILPIQIMLFSFQVAMDIIRNDEDQEPQNVNEYQHRNDWLKWKEAIKTKLRSLAKREVFGPVVQTPTNIQLVGYQWVFV